MGLTDFWKSLTPIDDEQEQTLKLQQEAAASAPVVAASVSPSAPQGVQEYDVAAAVAPLVAPREANYKASRIQIPTTDNKANKDREDEFNSILGDLRKEYKDAQEDARSRQMKAEMMAAVGNNIGNIVAGAQAMNTKASVTAPQMHKIEVKDMVGRVDKNFKENYANLLKQYKDLQDGGLTAKDKLYANIAQAQLDAGAQRMNANIENTDRNAGMRGVGMVKSAQDKNELSDKQTELFRTADNVLAEFGRVRELKKGVNTGPLQKLRNQGASMLGIDDPNVTALKAKTLNALSEKIKALSGAAASDSEVGRLQVTLPDIGQDDDVFDRLLQEAEDQIKRAIESDKKNIKKYQRKNVDGYAQPAQVDDAFEARMQKAMAANPNASRAQIEDALKKRK